MWGWIVVIAIGCAEPAPAEDPPAVEGAESVAAEPVAAEPVAAEPVAAEPEAAEPEPQADDLEPMGRCHVSCCSERVLELQAQSDDPATQNECCFCDD